MSSQTVDKSGAVFGEAIAASEATASDNSGAVVEEAVVTDIAPAWVGLRVEGEGEK